MNRTSSNLILKLILILSAFAFGTGSYAADGDECEAPTLEILGDAEAKLCISDDTTITWTAIHTNDIPITDTRWFYKRDGQTKWNAISGDGTTSLSIQNPQTTTEYLLLVYNGYCVSDSIIFKADVRAGFSIRPNADIKICEGTGVNWNLNSDRHEQGLDSLTYYFNGETTGYKDSYLIKNIMNDTVVSYTATDGYCTASRSDNVFIAERRHKITLSTPKEQICEDEEVEFTIQDVNPSRIHYYWCYQDNDKFFAFDDGIDKTIKVKVNEPLNFVVITLPTLYCPLTASNVVPLTIEDSIRLELVSLPDSICPGEAINLSVNILSGNPQSYKWSANGDELDENSTTLSDNPEIDTEYEFTVAGLACPAKTIKTEVGVYKHLNLELESDNYIVCHGNAPNLKLSGNGKEPLVWLRSTDGETMNEFDINDESLMNQEETTYYQVKSKSNEKCEYDFSNIVKIEVEEKATVELNETPDVVCAGEEITLSAIANNSVASYGWYKNGNVISQNRFTTTDIITEKNTYEFVAKGVVCPAVSKSVTIDVEDSIRLELKPVPTLICLGETVDLDAKIISGNPQSYNWTANGENITSASTTLSHTPEESTVYELSVKGEICPAVSVKKEVSIREPLTLEVTSEDAIVCEDGNPRLSVTCSENTPVIWLRSSDNETFEEFDINDPALLLHSGTTYFQAKSKAAENCKYDFSNVVMVEAEQKASINLDQVPLIVCNGESVSLNATVSGDAYNYEWKKNGVAIYKDGPSTTDIITATSTYEFSAEGNVCPAVSKSVTIDVEDSIRLEMQPVPTLICLGETVDLDAKIISGNPQSYNWTANGENITSASTTLSHTPEENTVYELSVKGEICPAVSVKKEVSIREPLTLEVTSEDAIVCEDGNPRLSVNCSENTPVIWLRSSDNETFEEFDINDPALLLHSGTTYFQAKSRAAENCKYDFSNVVMVEAEQKASINLDQVPLIVCNGESVSLNATVSGDAYNYEWKKNGVSIYKDGPSTTDIITATSTYEFSVEGNVCPAVSKSVTIDVEDSIRLEMQPAPSLICLGETVDLDAKIISGNPQSYNWTANGENITSASTNLSHTPEENTVYELSVKGEICPAVSVKKEVSIREPLTLEVTSEDAIVCEDGNPRLSVTCSENTPVTWLRSSDNETFEEFDINDPALLHSGTTYFQAKSKAAENCKYDFSNVVMVEAEQKASINLDQVPLIVCNGESVSLNATVSGDAYNYEWKKNGVAIYKDGPSTTDIITATSTYEFSVEGNVCPAVSKSVTIDVEDSIRLELQPAPTLICLGETVDLDAKIISGNPLSFNWTANGENITSASTTLSHTPDESTVYELSVKGEICPAVSVKKEVSIREPLTLEVTSEDAIVCEDGNPRLSVTCSENTPVIWLRSSDNETFEEFDINDPTLLLNSGTTYFQAKSKATENCKYDFSNVVMVEAEQNLQIELGEMPETVCVGGEINLNASMNNSSATFEWRKDGNVISKNELSTTDVVTPNTTYEFEAKGVVCPAVVTEVKITAQEPQKLEIIASKQSICEHDDVTLTTVQTGFTDLVFENLKNGTYQAIQTGVEELTVIPTIDTHVYRLSGRDKNGCEAKSNPIDITLTPSITLEMEDAIICKGDEKNLNVSNIYKKVEWSTEGEVVSTGNSLNVSPKEDTNYKITVQNGECTAETDFTIKVIEAPHIISHEMIDDHTCQFTTEDATETAYFSYGNNSEKTTSDIMTGLVIDNTYTITVSNETGCSSTYTFTTPNVDLYFPIYFYQGEENWKVENITKFNRYTVSIFDRFGKLLFKEENAENGWDGIYNGNPMPTTDYWYIVDIEDIDKQYTGHFTLLRKK